MKTKNVLITYAVEQEYTALQAHGHSVTYLQTGIGKTQSAHALTKRILEARPDLVLNIGTAGTHAHAVGDIFVANRFVDRDFQAIRLQGLPFEIEGLLFFEAFPRLKTWIDHYERLGLCSTGDSFVTQASSHYGDVVDMEAYAQAYVCRDFAIPFLSVKYVTDVIGQNSVQHWENKLADARKGLGAWFEANRLLAQIAE